MRPVFPAIWLSVRGVWVALGLSVLLAVASVVPGLIYLFVAAAVASSAQVTLILRGLPVTGSVPP